MNELAHLERVANQRRALEREYRAAIVRAREAGATMQAIGDAAGIGRSGVNFLLKNGKGQS